jgi:hypothetical protein
MNIGLAIDKKNGVDNRTGNIKTGGVGTDSNSGCYNINNGKSNMKQEYEERIAKNQNDYLKLIEEELKKQGVENIEWK